MANNCFVWIDYEFASAKDANRFAAWLKDRKQEAEADDSCCMYYGADSRLMEDGDISTTDQTKVHLSGVVRWVLELWDFMGAVKAALAFNLQRASAKYDEGGDLLYGVYEYANGMFKERQLPDSEWPDPPEGITAKELDEWYEHDDEHKDAAMKEHGKDLGPFTMADVEKQFAQHVAQWNEIRNRSNAEN